MSAADASWWGRRRASPEVPFTALVLLATMLSNCAATPGVGRASASCAGESAVAAVLDDFHDAAAHADESRYFSHFAPAGVFLGTDATERWDVAAFRTYAHPHFARGRAWNFHAVERHVTLHDARTAWFDERLATERLGPARGTGVVVCDRTGHWRIEQYNLTLTVPNERFDAVRRALEAPDASAP